MHRRRGQALVRASPSRGRGSSPTRRRARVGAEGVEPPTSAL
jgi:hypothetical protein